jgi:hypothetical protein
MTLHEVVRRPHHEEGDKLLTYTIREAMHGEGYYGSVYQDNLPAHFHSQVKPTIDEVMQQFPLVPWEEPDPSEDDPDIVAIFISNARGDTLRNDRPLWPSREEAEDPEN